MSEELKELLKFVAREDFILDQYAREVKRITPELRNEILLLMRSNP